jgi:hypothetical protein
MVTSSTKTYDQDFALWVEENIALLKAKNYEAVDWDNLIEEVEGLTRSDKRELEDRLIISRVNSPPLGAHEKSKKELQYPAACGGAVYFTLFEHALKRRYVPLPDCYRGWEVILKRTQKQLRRVLNDSPSLRNYFISIIEEYYQDALINMRDEYDAILPDRLPFSEDIDQLLMEEFWN